MVVASATRPASDNEHLSPLVRVGRCRERRLRRLRHHPSRGGWMEMKNVAERQLELSHKKKHDLASIVHRIVTPA